MVFSVLFFCWAQDVQISQSGLIKKLDVRDASLIDLLRFLADRAEIQLVIDASVEDRQITIVLHNLSALEAIKTILRCEGLAWCWENTLGRVSNILEAPCSY
ncbi:MAG: hypothetical protein KDC71_20770 [Acidobacteria bacterium]|nr:hypothetical protein [Acidobacteriota bacterium]